MSPKTPEHKPIAIVLAPEILAKSFHDTQCRNILELWRDGAIRLVITRDLLVSYLRLLKALGIRDDILRRWTQWFTAKDKSTVFLDAKPAHERPADSLAHAAQLGNAHAILYAKIPAAAPSSDAPGDNAPPHQTVTEFLDLPRANE